MADKRPLVVVVNDDEAMRDALRFVLRLEGADVCTYADGAALLADAMLPAASCLVLNQHLPEMDGLELLARLRARGFAVPAILLTSAATPALRARAAAAGVLLVLEKPILDDTLVDAVAGVLRRAARQLRDNT